MKTVLNAFVGILLLPVFILLGAVIGLGYGVVYACRLWNFNMNHRSGVDGDWEFKLP